MTDYETISRIRLAVDNTRTKAMPERTSWSERIAFFFALVGVILAVYAFAFVILGLK